ncbi:MAG: hypothetical protein ACO3LE_00380 [Bdellovibrionota bacterium]
MEEPSSVEEPSSKEEPSPSEESAAVQTEAAETKMESQESAPILSFPFETQIKSRVAQILAQPSNEARVLLLVRQADKLKVLGEEAEFFQVEYFLENQYPIKGFIRKEYLGDLSSQTEVSRSTEQSYTPSLEREAVQTEALELEDQKSQQRIEIPATLKKVDSLELITTPTESVTEKTKSPEEWKYSLEFDLGWQQYQERVFTLVGGAYPNIPLIDYSLEGIDLQFGFSIFRRWFGSVDAGARAQYEVSALQADVKRNNAQIEAADALAQWHRLSVEIFASRDFQIKKWLLQPELAARFQWHLFSVNQLRDKNLAQPILFSNIGYYGEIAFRPKLQSPYFLSLQGYLGLLLFYQFSEGPLQSTEQGIIQTGTPNSQKMLLQYGGSLAWDLKSLGLKDQEIILGYRFEDLSKSFSGEGNRAGFKLQEAQSKSKIHRLSLGYRFDF